MSHNCNYCQNKFTTKSYLNYHQKNAKYCLDKQGGSKGVNFKCEYCKKILSSYKRLKTHYTSCDQYMLDDLKSKHNVEINQYQTIIKTLEFQLQEYKITIRIKPNHVEAHYNLDQSLQNISENRIQQGRSNQQYTMTAANILTDMLSNLLNSLQNTGIWGPKGRIYNAGNPNEGPYLDRKPIKELKGFYKRDDPEVIKK